MSDHVDLDDLPHQVQIDRLRENYERGNGSCRFTDDTESMFVSEDCGGDLNIVIYGPIDGQMGFASLGPEEVIRLFGVLRHRVESYRIGAGQ